MFCNKCGNPLPNEGAVCKFCGAMMSEEQIKMIREQKKEKEFRPELMTEKYGQSKIGYRDDNKNSNIVVVLFVMGGIVLFIIILAIILNS